MKFFASAALALAISVTSFSASAQLPAEPTRASELVVEAEAQQPMQVPTEHFAGRSAFKAFEISPDGKRLLVKRDVEGVNELIVLDTDSMQPTERFRLREDQQADWVKWAGNDKLIMSVSYPGFFYGYPIRVSRMFVRDLKTDQYFALDVDERVFWGGEIVHLAEDGSYALVSVQDAPRNTPSVFRYALVPDAKPERLVKPHKGVWDWHADDDGIVRLGMGWLGKRLRIYYRGSGEEKFDLVGKLKADDEKSRYWDVVQIVSGSDRGYVLEEGENGRVGVRLFDYAAGESVETFYENPDWDVEQLWLKRDGTPRSALFTDDRERIVWFDEEDEKLYASLKKALKMEDLHLLTRARENDRALVWAGSEADPGALYMFDPAGKELKVFANYRPELDHRQLVKSQPVTYKARDGLAIRSYLTLPRGRAAKNLPLIIMPHGGPYGVRDSLSYNDEVQLLANRGYAVLQPNFRGSGGYGEEFFEKGTGQIGRAMQDDLDDAVAHLVAEGIVDPERVCILGSSYGGYAAMWGAIRNPEIYRCAASFAGVSHFERQLAHSRDYLFGRNRGRFWNRVDGDQTNFDLDDVSPAVQVARLTRPLLLVHGEEDDIVPHDQYRLMVSRAESAGVEIETLSFPDAGHGFDTPEDEQRYYDTLLAFLARHNPAD